jgi:hypothetical protein
MHGNRLQHQDCQQHTLIFISASKFTCTLFSFAATTAALPMNREIQDMSASVQVKVGTNSL